MLNYSYRCRPCDAVFTRSFETAEAYVNAEIRCGCGSRDVHRHAETPYHPGLTEGKGRMDRKYPYVSNQLPRGMKGCRHTKVGKPIIESKTHERNIMAGGGNGERFIRD